MKQFPALAAAAWRWLLARQVRVVLSLVIASVPVAVVITTDDDPSTPPRIHIELGGPGNTEITAPAAAIEQAATAVDHQDARDEQPAGVTHAEQVARQDALESYARTDQLPLVSPDAAPSFSGCTSRFVRNYSSRGGVKPRLLVAHYTVSRNRPGWDDVNAIVGLFDRASYQASSNFVIDAEGHCAYIVRDTDKAWTQAAANPYSVSIEFVAMGDEGHLSKAAIRKGAHVFAIEAKRWGIPVRRGAVRGCVPSRTGIVMHADLGTCGGGHTDIRPFPLKPLITATRKAARPHVTKADNAECRRVRNYRHRAHHNAGGTRAYHARLKRIRARGLRCVNGHAAVRR